MKKIINNNDNLKYEDLDEIVTRVKVFFINSNNEILLASSAGGYQLPGGHVEDGEKINEAIFREMKEETGISLDQNEAFEPFLIVDTIKKNNRGTGKNRLARILYYLIKSDAKPNLNDLNLTDNEKANNFKVIFIPFGDFYKTMKDVEINNEIEVNRIIASENLFAFSQLENYLKENK